MATVVARPSTIVAKAFSPERPRALHPAYMAGGSPSQSTEAVTPSSSTAAAASGAFAASAAPPTSSFGRVRVFARVRPLNNLELKKVPEGQAVARPAIVCVRHFSAVIGPQGADSIVSPVARPLAPAPGAMQPPAAQAAAQQAQALRDELANLGHDEGVFVLDPERKFTRRKGGAFGFFRVLSGVAPDDGSRELPTVSQSDVYLSLRSVMDGVKRGYNTAVVVCGPSKTGKTHTLFGDVHGTDPEGRGVVPRFALELFRALQDRRDEHERSEVKVELEFVELSSTDNNSIIDLLSPNPARPNVVKLREDQANATGAGPSPASPAAAAADPAYGVGASILALQGATRVSVGDGPAFMSQLKMGLRNARKRDPAAHLVLNVRFTETFTFEDPADATRQVSKVAKFTAQFALVNGVPTAVARCIDAAACRDAGVIPNAKVPLRETNLTRLLGDCFGGNCETHMVLCVSPFYLHAKEAVQAMDAVARFGLVRTRARLTVDSETSVFRRLCDEVKGMSTALVQTSEAQNVVQRELDRRQTLLDNAALDYENAFCAQSDAQEHEMVQLAARRVMEARLRRRAERDDAETVDMRVEMQALERRLTQSRVDSENLDRDLAAAKQRQVDMEARYGPLCEQRDALIAIVAKERQRREEADQVQPALEAARRTALEAHDARAEKLRIQLVRTQRDRDEATATSAIMEEEAAVTQRAADAVAVVEVRLEGTRTRRQALEQERETLLRDIEELQRKLAELEAENKQLSGGCCQCQ